MDLFIFIFWFLFSYFFRLAFLLVLLRVFIVVAKKNWKGKQYLFGVCRVDFNDDSDYFFCFFFSLCIFEPTKKKQLFAVLIAVRMAFVNQANAVVIPAMWVICVINCRAMHVVPSMDNVKMVRASVHKDGMANIVHYVSINIIHYTPKSNRNNIYKRTLFGWGSVFQKELKIECCCCCCWTIKSNFNVKWPALRQKIRLNYTHFEACEWINKSIEIGK